MTVPKYDEMMLPILEHLHESQSSSPLSNKQIREFVIEYFSLDENDRSELISSGLARYISNAQWACTYLKQAKLISSPRRGLFEISERGEALLLEKPEKITKGFLLRYPEFQQFANKGGKSKGELASNGKRGMEKGIASSGDDELTPEDALAFHIKNINAALATDLLDEILQQPPEFFEKLVVDLLLAMGYGDLRSDAGEVTPRSNDEGIDGVVREDKLGFDSIYIQAKRWGRERNVGRPELQGFVGALTGLGANKGLFITTAHFSSVAQDYARKQHAVKLVLVDGEELARLMIAHNVGVSVRRHFEVKSIDRDYFDSEA